MNPILLLLPILGLGAYALMSTKAAAQKPEPEKPDAKKPKVDKEAAKRKYAQLLLSYEKQNQILST
jgi:hypothetical protein